MFSFLWIIYFFFFQAEDGIRDATVTGVQTCALPICTSETLLAVIEAPFLDGPGKIEALYLATLSRKPSAQELARLTRHVRSEERRVGKECRARGGTERQKKKKEASDEAKSR